MMILAIMTSAFSFAGMAVLPSPAVAASITVDQCNNVGPGPGGATTGLDCAVTVVNTISGGITSSTTTVIRTCSLDPCPSGNGTFTSSSTNLVTEITQCNGSSNDAAHPITCTVSVTNNISADTPGAQPVTAATVNQCVGSGTGGGLFGSVGPLNCNPFPATTTGATVTQCNGSVTGGGSTADCAVSSASVVSPAILTRVNQCNGTGNAGGTLLTCRTSITTNITAAAAATPTAIPTAVVTPIAKPVVTPVVKPVVKPQISKVPAGGVAAGDGSSTGPGHIGLLSLGSALMLAAAISALTLWRVTRRS